MRAQRCDEAEVIELQGAQAQRELTHALQGMSHRADALRYGSGRAGLLTPRKGLQLYFQRGQRLANVVVELARESPALVLLHLEKPTRQRAQPVLRSLERPLGCQMALALGALLERPAHSRGK